MAKDSYWFKHDSTAGRGLRLRKIQHIYGHWGKGVYWDVIEVLREQSDYTHESSEMALLMLSDIIGCKDESKFLSWYQDCINFGLLIEENDHFYSEKLLDIMGTWEAKKSNGSKGGRPKAKTNKNLNESETKAKRKLIKSETKANQNHKRREEKIIEEKSIPFEKALDEYGYCQNLTDAKQLWEYLSKEEQLKVMKHIPEYIKNHESNNKRQYLPDFANYLSKQRYNAKQLPYKSKEVTAGDSNYKSL